MGTPISQAADRLRQDLARKLRSSRLAPVWTNAGYQSGPGFSDLGTMSGYKEPDFVGKFGPHLEKVGEADIAALALLRPPQDSFLEAVLELSSYVNAAPVGKTGLSYFDDWTPQRENVSVQKPVLWQINNQEEPRQLIACGYYVLGSQPDAGGDPESFLTLFGK